VGEINELLYLYRKHHRSRRIKEKYPECFDENVLIPRVRSTSGIKTLSFKTLRHTNESKCSGNYLELQNKYMCFKSPNSLKQLSLSCDVKTLFLVRFLRPTISFGQKKGVSGGGKGRGGAGRTCDGHWCPVQ